MPPKLPKPKGLSFKSKPLLSSLAIAEQIAPSSNRFGQHETEKRVYQVRGHQGKMVRIPVEAIVQPKHTYRNVGLLNSSQILNQFLSQQQGETKKFKRPLLFNVTNPVAQKKPVNSPQTRAFGTSPMTWALPSIFGGGAMPKKTGNNSAAKQRPNKPKPPVSNSGQFGFNALGNSGNRKNNGPKKHDNRKGDEFLQADGAPRENNRDRAPRDNTRDRRDNRPPRDNNRDNNRDRAPRDNNQARSTSNFRSGNNQTRAPREPFVPKVNERDLLTEFLKNHEPALTHHTIEAVTTIHDQLTEAIQDPDSGVTNKNVVYVSPEGVLDAKAVDFMTALKDPRLDLPHKSLRLVKLNPAMIKTASLPSYVTPQYELNNLTKEQLQAQKQEYKARRKAAKEEERQKKKAIESNRNVLEIHSTWSINLRDLRKQKFRKLTETLTEGRPAVVSFASKDIREALAMKRAAEPEMLSDMDRERRQLLIDEVRLVAEETGAQMKVTGSMELLMRMTMKPPS